LTAAGRKSPTDSLSDVTARYFADEHGSEYALATGKARTEGHDHIDMSEYALTGAGESPAKSHAALLTPSALREERRRRGLSYQAALLEPTSLDTFPVITPPRSSRKSILVWDAEAEDAEEDAEDDEGEEEEHAERGEQGRRDSQGRPPPPSAAAPPPPFVAAAVPRSSDSPNPDALPSVRSAVPTVNESLSNQSSVSHLHSAAAAMAAQTAAAPLHRTHGVQSTDTTPASSAHTSAHVSRLPSARPSAEHIQPLLTGHELAENATAEDRARVLGAALNSLPRSGGSQGNPISRGPPPASSSGAAGPRAHVGARTSNIAKLQHALQQQSAAVGRKARADFGGDAEKLSTHADQHAALAKAAAELAATLPPQQPVPGPTLRNPDAGLGIAQRLAQLGHNQRDGTSPALVALTSKGKPAATLSWAQMYAQALDIAAALRDHRHLKPPAEGAHPHSGDCVGLMFDTTQPDGVAHFATALHGCLAAGIAAVPIACPSAADVELEAKTGSLLGACLVNTVLTDKATLKKLQGSRQRPGVDLRHWPQLAWLRVDALGKDSGKGSQRALANLPHRSQARAAALILSHYDADNNVRPVIVEHDALQAHCAALTHAIGGSPDTATMPPPLLVAAPLQSGAGLWHGLLAPVYSGVTVFVAACGDSHDGTQADTADAAATATAMASPLLAALRQGPAVASEPLDVLVSGKVARALGEPAVVRLAAGVGLGRVRRLLLATDAPLAPSVLRSLEALRTGGLSATAIGSAINTSRGGTLAVAPPGVLATRPAMVRAGLLRRGILEHATGGQGIELLPVGQPLPGQALAVVGLGTAMLCRQRQLGEIVVTAGAAASGYRGLEQQSRRDFDVRLTGQPAGQSYVRTGLVGCIDATGPGPSNQPSIYVVGTLAALLVVDGCWINAASVADSIAAAASAHRSQGKVHREAMALFTVQAGGRTRLVALIEANDATAVAAAPVSDSAQAAVGTSVAEAWMAVMLRAVADEHGTAPLYMALVEPETLPRLRHGGATDVPASAALFAKGQLPLAALLVDGLQCRGDLPRAGPRMGLQHLQPGMAPMAIMAAADGRLSEAAGPRMELSDNVKAARSVVSLLVKRQMRGRTSPLFTVVMRRGKEEGLTAESLLCRARRGAGLLARSGVMPGTPVMLLLPPSAAYVVAFYSCLLLGAVPVTMATPRSREEVRQWLPVAQGVLSASRACCVLTDDKTWRKVRHVDKAWATQPGLKALHLDRSGSTEHGAVYSPAHRSEVAYVEYSVSSRGVLAGVAVTHQMMLTIGQAFAAQSCMEEHACMVTCSEASSGLGLALHTYIPLFASECHMILVDAAADAHPYLWLRVASEKQASAAVVSYLPLFNSVMAVASSEGRLLGHGLYRHISHAPGLHHGLGGQQHSQRHRQPNMRRSKDGAQGLDPADLDLSGLRRCIVLSRERPWLPVLEAFVQAFQVAQLGRDVMCTALEVRCNALVAMSGPQRLQPLYVDVRSLRDQRLQLLERGSPHEVAILPVGPLAPGVRVAVVEPETEQRCAGNEVGEVWASSIFNAASFSGLAPNVLQRVNEEHLERKLPGHSSTYARTGLAGFLHEGLLYIVGSMEDFLLVDTMT
jgi:acyl-CoA synthetase (AMP-forming)/AMP-acid ligase II